MLTLENTQFVINYDKFIYNQKFTLLKFYVI